MGAARAGRWNGQRRDGQCFVDYGRAPLRGREFPQRLAFVAASASRWMDESNSTPNASAMLSMKLNKLAMTRCHRTCCSE
jgi:hypothetical protein